MSAYQQANIQAIENASNAINQLNAQFGDSVVWDEYLAGIKKANDAIKSAATALNQFSPTMKTAVNSAQLFSASVASLQSAFVAAADLAYNNVNQLVALYQAQINVISAQNNYTQALALQATAVSVYGSNSEEATRATTAANYVGALYTQSKLNETVAQEQYYTATATNLATIATSFLQLTGAMQVFQIAQATLTAAALTESSDLTIASVVPFAGLAIAGGLTAYELLSQPSPNATSASAAQTSHGGGSKAPEIHIHASSNVDLARVRHEVVSALSEITAHSQRQRGNY